jgi:hypothetical protein
MAPDTGVITEDVCIALQVLETVLTGIVVAGSVCVRIA